MVKRFSHGLAACGIALSLACAVLLCAPLQQAQAVPAYDGVQVMEQPNGATFSYRIYGDEYFHWYTTADGLLIQKDASDDTWKYVADVNGMAVLANAADEGAIAGEPFDTSRLADDAAKAAYYALADEGYAPISRDLGDAVTVDRLAESQGTAQSNTFSASETTTSLPLVAIAVEFSNQTYREDYDWGSSIFSGEFSTSTFWSETSDGAFSFVPASESSALGENSNRNTADAENDGIIHVTLTREHGNWQSPSDDATMGDFHTALKEALDAASPSIDFTQYDANGDGKIGTDELGLLFIIAGYESAVGVGNEPGIWAHRSMMDWYVVDGVGLSDYVCIGEQMKMDGTERPGNVSTITHELGHYLGLPDLYDVEYNTDGAWGSFDVGTLSLMAGGNWGQDGSQFIATGLDPLCRLALGYIEVPIVENSGAYTISSITSTSGYQAYMVPAARDDEYFIIENRQYESFDRGLWGNYAAGASESLVNDTGGIVVWHVDLAVWSEYLETNRVNTTEHPPALMPVFPEEAALNDGKPLVHNPFYNKSVLSALPDEAVKLLLYNGDTPAGRVDSGIKFDAATPAALDMKVEITLPTKTNEVVADVSDVTADGGNVIITVSGEYLPSRIEAHVFEQTKTGEVRVSDSWGTVVSDVSDTLERDALSPVMSTRTLTVAIPPALGKGHTYIVKVTFDSGATYESASATVVQAGVVTPDPDPDLKPLPAATPVSEPHALVATGDNNDALAAGILATGSLAGVVLSVVYLRRRAA